ncbi:MAG: OmpA family protein [Methylococcales bacterium]|jgi:chemotaxis protein MotB|nr:OmpA family protein [Methylococcales bacterium]MBT7411093.1 OmpA family protein [Methylococcales bacterium]
MKKVTFKQIDNDNDKEDEKEWLITYADAITLLMAFFVLLLSTAVIDQSKYEQVSESITKRLLQKQPKTPFKTLEDEISTLISKNQLANVIEVNKVIDGIKIELSNSALFSTGSAQLKLLIQPILFRISQFILSLDNLDNINIDVEGHSDNVPINTRQYPSNWELSARRATNVVRFLIKQGIEENKLRAVAYAHTQPKLPNNSQSGQALLENQAVNRRVVLYVKR